MIPGHAELLALKPHRAIQKHLGKEKERHTALFWVTLRLLFWSENLRYEQEIPYVCFILSLRKKNNKPLKQAFVLTGLNICSGNFEDWTDACTWPGSTRKGGLGHPEDPGIGCFQVSA